MIKFTPSERTLKWLDRVLGWPARVPMARMVDLLLAFNWLWYAFVSLLPPDTVVSTLLTYFNELGVGISQFGIICLFMALAKFYGQIRNDWQLRTGLLVIDLTIASVFVATLAANDKLPLSLGPSLITLVLVFITLLKTALRKDGGGSLFQ